MLLWICINSRSLPLLNSPCRYMAIIHPLQQRLSSAETKLVVGVIWALALLLAFPQYYFSSTAQLPGRVVCYINWPEYSVFDFQKTWVCSVKFSDDVSVKWKIKSVTCCKYSEINFVLNNLKCIFVGQPTWSMTFENVKIHWKLDMNYSQTRSLSGTSKHLKGILLPFRY